jgi:rubrerythrin
MKREPAPLEHCWVCEGCSDVTEGVNPPDLCRLCEHEFFENMSDLLAEKQAASAH